MAKKEKKSVDKKPYDELNAKLDDMQKRGMAKTQVWSDMWQEGLRYFFSDQLLNFRRHKDWDWVIMNYIWPSAMQEVAKLSKNNPKIIVHPWEDDDVESAEAWQSKFQWDWQKGLNNRGMRQEQIAAILDGKIFGYRVSKVYWEDQVSWDDDEKEWVGDVRTRLWHPAHFWASDDERIDDGDCGTVRYAPLDWAIRRWPKFEEKLRLEAKKVAADGTFGDQTVRGSRSATGSAAAIAAGLSGGGSEKDGRDLRPNKLISIILGLEQTGMQDAHGDIEFVKIDETYFRDYSDTNETIEEDIPSEELLASGKIYTQDNNFFDSQTDSPLTFEQWPKRVVKKYKQPKFPTGRVVIRCGHTILNPDGKDQKYPYSRWPFVVTPHYLLPHMWQGMNAVELYRSMQDMINISVSHLYNNMKQFGDPKVAIEEGAIALNPKTKKHYKILSAAGSIIRLARGAISKGKYKIHDPVPPSAGTILLYQLFTQEFKNLTGLQSIGRGEQEKHGMTATEAQHLALSSYDRVALQSIYEDEWVKGIVGLDAEISQANYNIGRWIRVVGKDKLVGAIQISQKLKTAKFDIDIEPSSQLPFDEEKRIAKYIQAYELLKDPAPNPLLPEVLRILEISNWKEVLDKHQGWQYYMEFLELYNAVKAGQIAPEQAVQMLMKRTMQVYQREQAEGLPAAGAPAGGKA